MKRTYKKIEFTNETKEDKTKFGEFVCTFHQWLPLSEQKEKAIKMSNITRNK